MNFVIEQSSFPLVEENLFKRCDCWHFTIFNRLRFASLRTQHHLLQKINQHQLCWRVNCKIQESGWR